MIIDRITELLNNSNIHTVDIKYIIDRFKSEQLCVAEMEYNNGKLRSANQIQTKYFTKRIFTLKNKISLLKKERVEK